MLRSDKQQRKKEARETRLLKPSISGNSLQYDEPAKRASSRKLDLDAPLLSVRKSRAPERSSPSSSQEAGASVSSRVSRSSSNLGPSMRQLVPFFTWEQSQAAQQAIVPVTESSRARNIKSTGETGLILAPPPRPQQQPQQQRQIILRDKKNTECSDVRSEFAYTEHASVAPTYVVSNAGTGELEDEEELSSAITEYNSADRDMILRRFLPAAKAVAIEMSSSSRFEAHEGSWRPVIAHPSPQVHYNRQPNRAQEQVGKAEKKSFGEFLSVRQAESIDGGGDNLVEGSCSSHFISDSACGFFPLLRLLQTSTSSCKPCRPEGIARNILEVDADKSSEEEWFSDQGGEEEEEYELSQAAYMACKYTPSRGGLKSPAIAESKGFLGMPRDRVGKTYIKRMYPVPESITGESKNQLQENNSDAESVSSASESLSSMKLDKRSAENSRQSSSEKVFCLDTLNQVRAGVAEQKRSLFIGGEETLITIVDERSRNPSVVEDSSPPVSHKSRKNSNGKKLKEKMIETMRHRRMLRGGSNKSEDSYYEDAEDDEDDEEEDAEQFKTPSELRICWQERYEDKVIIPTPRGPSQSWLKKKLVQAQKAELLNAAFRKPPLARKPASMISFDRQRF